MGDHFLQHSNAYGEPPCPVPMLRAFHLDESGLLAAIKKLTLLDGSVSPYLQG